MLNKNGNQGLGKSSVKRDAMPPVRHKPTKRMNLRKPQIGASGIEYAVIAGLIIVAFVAAFSVLDLDQFFTDIATELGDVIPAAAE